MIDANDARPVLRAVILDCAAVSQVDTTSVQALVDTRDQLARHAAPELVEWHLAGVRNRWARRAFAAAGFGFPSTGLLGGSGASGVPRWAPVYTVAAVDEADDASDVGSYAGEKRPAAVALRGAEDIESVGEEDLDNISSASKAETALPLQAGGRGAARLGRLAAIQGVNRPFLHLSVEDAVDSAIANIEARAGRRGGPVSA